MKSLILSNFEVFLKAFAKAFGEHDKAYSTTINIHSLHQGSHSGSVYAFEFRQ